MDAYKLNEAQLSDIREKIQIAFPQPDLSKRASSSGVTFADEPCGFFDPHACQTIAEDLTITITVGECTMDVTMNVDYCYSNAFDEWQFIFDLNFVQPTPPGASQECIDQILQDPGGIQAAIDKLNDQLISEYQEALLTSVAEEYLIPCTSVNDYQGVVAVYYEATCIVRCLGGGKLIDFEWREETCEGSACCVSRRGYCIDSEGQAYWYIQNDYNIVPGSGCDAEEAPCQISDDGNTVSNGFGTCRFKGKTCHN